MKLTITQISTGTAHTMNWRNEKGKSYSGTAAHFLYNLPRAQRIDFRITTEDGREIKMSKACAAAAEEMNAIRNGHRIPAMPQF